MQKIRVLLSDTFDPWFNLATEDWIFRDMDPDTHILFLWRNSETVVIGRFQNPWTECNTAKMEEDGIKLARRQSGGGAVFQDLGNTNFTFMSGRNNYDKSVNNKIITEAISSFGPAAYPSGRNDILVDDGEGPKKISGSAFKENNDRCFHHGTLLINADLNKLGNYLNPDKKKLTSKGIASVRSRVTNLSLLNQEITHESLSRRIIAEFFKHYGTECQVELLNHETLANEPQLNEYYLRLKDWSWRFGETPKFNHQMSERFSWGNMDVHLDSHKGRIEGVQIFSDSLHPEMIEQLMDSFAGRTYDSKGIAEAVAVVKAELPMIGDHLDEFQDWMIREIR